MSKRSDRNRRMRRWLHSAPPPPGSAAHDPLLQAHIERMAAMDVGISLRIKEMTKWIPAFIASRMLGGSGARMASLLRWYLQEYVTRTLEHGPHSLPASFNVVADFLDVNKQHPVYDLLEEREHVIELQDFLDWYDADVAQHLPTDVVLGAIPENVILSYDFCETDTQFRLNTEDSELIVAGASLVRDGSRISIVLLAGESPPYPPDEGGRYEGGQPIPGREAITPAEDLSEEDRYLESHPKHGKVILLTRCDLVRGTYDVRYVNLDVGLSFQVLTDDPEPFRSLPRAHAEELMQKCREELPRYEQLYSLAASLTRLPLFFASLTNRTMTSDFPTELSALEGKAARRIRELVGATGFVEQRAVRFSLRSAAEGYTTSIRTMDVQPPGLEFSSAGYWRPLAAGEVGRDPDGKPVFGRTWVERNERWTAAALGAFVGTLEVRAAVEGPDPGTIYVMRSPSHGPDVYKIGLTRRTALERAKELSTPTGVPTSFFPVATYEVGDCAAAEKAIHLALANVRVNPRREFFHGDLRWLNLQIEDVLNELEQSGPCG